MSEEREPKTSRVAKWVFRPYACTRLLPTPCFSINALKSLSSFSVHFPFLTFWFKPFRYLWKFKQPLPTPHLRPTKTFPSNLALKRLQSSHCWVTEHPAYNLPNQDSIALLILVLLLPIMQPFSVPLENHHQYTIERQSPPCLSLAMSSIGIHYKHTCLYIGNPSSQGPSLESCTSPGFHILPPPSGGARK